MRFAAVMMLLAALPIGAQVQSDDVFVACRGGAIESPAEVYADRPLWRAEGFPSMNAAAAFAAGVTGARIAQLSPGAFNPFLVLWNTGPFDWNHYLGPTHWPVKTYAASEEDLGLNDVRTHELLREPWAVVSTGDLRWPMIVAFEASSPCAPPKTRAVRGH